MGVVTAAIVGAVGAAIGGIVSALVNKSSVKDTNEANKQLAEQQNDWNIQAVDKANEYNTPSNQVQRLKDAGLNPNMFYDSGANAVATSTAPSSADLANQIPYQIQNPDFSGFANVANAYLQTKQLKLEAKKVGLQEKSVDNQIVKTSAEINYLNAQINLMAKQGLVADATAANLVKQNELIAAQTEQCHANIQLLGAETSGQIIENLWKDKQYETQIKEAESRMKLNNSQIAYNRQSIQNLIAQEDATRATIKLTEGEIELVKAQNGIISIDLESLKRYQTTHKRGRDRELMDMQVWLNHVANGANAITAAEVDRRNAATNEQNAETNKRNAATNERNADTNKTNAAANIFRALRGGN